MTSVNSKSGVPVPKNLDIAFYPVIRRLDGDKLNSY